MKTLVVKAEYMANYYNPEKPMVMIEVLNSNVTPGTLKISRDHSGEGMRNVSLDASQCSDQYDGFKSGSSPPTRDGSLPLKPKFSMSRLCSSSSARGVASEGPFN
jgi:hypothetical protein